MKCACLDGFFIPRALLLTLGSAPIRGSPIKDFFRSLILPPVFFNPPYERKISSKFFCQTMSTLRRNVEAKLAERNFYTKYLSKYQASFDSHVPQYFVLMLNNIHSNRGVLTRSGCRVPFFELGSQYWNSV